ncbi:MAG: hypothetical protein ACKO40_09685 [Planctomycetaceae bacterium]
MSGRCVFVVGMESSGSKLVARALSHALGIQAYGTWNGSGWSRSFASPHRLCHRSQPYGRDSRFSDIRRWNEENRDVAIHYVVCTRDARVAERPQLARWSSPRGLRADQADRAREIIREVLATCDHTIWSDETFMLQGGDYLRWLYRTLGVDSDFIPADIADGNVKHVRRAA